MKTYNIKSKELEPPKWYLIDAKDLVLGRTASMIAKLLLGKHKPVYTPHADVGDYVIVINANQVKITGSKSTDKVYYRHSGKAGKLKQVTFDKLIVNSAEKLFKITVQGMLPKNTRGRDMLKKLKVYANSEHPHIAQQPIQLGV